MDGTGGTWRFDTLTLGRDLLALLPGTATAAGLCERGRRGSRRKVEAVIKGVTGRKKLSRWRLASEERASWERKYGGKRRIGGEPEKNGSTLCQYIICYERQWKGDAQRDCRQNEKENEKSKGFDWNTWYDTVLKWKEGIRGWETNRQEEGRRRETGRKRQIIMTGNWAWIFVKRQLWKQKRSLHRRGRLEAEESADATHFPRRSGKGNGSWGRERKGKCKRKAL